ncbi:MAG: RCC1 domain-containing protein, partial [Myxococcales bacterium]
MIVAACDPATELSFVTVSAGLMHTCGITNAGRAYCWGDNFVGQLGDGTATLFQTRPVAVAGGLRFAAVSAGDVHSCGQTTAGAAYCWGDNTSGELGDGTTINTAIPIWSTTPVQVIGGLGFAAVSAGGVVDNTGPHSCGVTTAGKAYCWGNNAYAELGDGTTIARASPVPVTGGLSFAALSVGGAHNCGITTAGVTFCWGDNSTGQLGDGTTTSRGTPVPVIGGLRFAVVSAGMRVASQTHAGGSAHTCGLTTAGTAYCWGDNTAGELGDGTTIPRTNPVAVAGGLSFAAVSVGGNHNCGITTAGTAYCWGDNTAGQLGDGTTLGRT